MGNSTGEFKAILTKIEKSEAVDDSELLPFLALESKDERLQVNLELAGTYFRRHEQRREVQDLSRARSCVERAWVLSRYSPALLPLFQDIHRLLGDVTAIEEAIKRAGMEHARLGSFGDALGLFDFWANAHVVFTGIDTHSYDADIIACVERMCAPHRFEARLRRRPREGRRTRLAYLMHGLTQPGSVLVKIDQVFARLHDKSRFEVAYFSVDDESAVADSPDAQAAIRNIREQQCEVFLVPADKALHEQLLAVGRQIYDFAPDVLITSAGLGTFKSYFITCLKPAPVTMTFHQGPSPQFSWHTFDHSISWFLTNLLDCPADCSHVPLEFDLPKRESISPASRADLNIPADATIMATGGRWTKLQGPEFWRTMAELLLEHDNLYWIVSGVVEDQVPFLGNVVTPAARSKIRFAGWSPDYLSLLAAADFVVDSYPVGGGVFMMEAMGLGIPVVSYEHDYVTYYDNNDSSGGEEILGIPELIVKRGDFGQLKDRVTKIVEDSEYRRLLGKRCYEQARRTHGDPARMVRRCEEIYERVLDEFYQRAANARFLPRLKRGLRRRWQKVRGWRPSLS